MKKRRIPLIVWVIILVATAVSRSQSQPHGASPIEVTRRFLQGVSTKNRQDLIESFDFDWANRDLTARLRAIDIVNPWTQRQITDTLVYYFFEPDQVSLARTLLATNVVFDARVNDKAKLALVVLSAPAKPGEKPKQLGTVGLRKLAGRWQIVYFPEFYPLDYWEILTGVRAQP